jgi:hypothetical protein
VTNSNSRPFAAQKEFPSAIRFPATAAGLPNAPAVFVLDEKYVSAPICVGGVLAHPLKVAAHKAITAIFLTAQLLAFFLNR